MVRAKVPLTHRLQVWQTSDPLEQLAYWPAPHRATSQLLLEEILLMFELELFELELFELVLVKILLFELLLFELPTLTPLWTSHCVS